MRARVRKGEVLVESAQDLGVRPDIVIPTGQIQHWVGAAFLQRKAAGLTYPH